MDEEEEEEEEVVDGVLVLVLVLVVAVDVTRLIGIGVTLACPDMHTNAGLLVASLIHKEARFTTI